jgi:cytochrome c peroxidase
VSQVATRATCVLLACWVMSTACRVGQGTADVEFTADDITRVLAMSRPSGIPADVTNAVSDQPAASQLGRTLFFDARLSARGDVSCATCHRPTQDWTDGLPLPQTAAGHGRRRHTPSLWNVAYNRWFFWDGRADSLWAQALKPIEDEREMGGSRVAVARLISSDRALRQAYERVFGSLPALGALPPRAKPDEPAQDDASRQAWAALDPARQHAVNVVFANVGKALAAFERTILSGETPFDAFARSLAAGTSQRSAYPVEAQRGLKLFIGSAGCANCHHGPTFTDHEFHNIGLADEEMIFSDAGRFEGIRAVRADPFNALGRHADRRPTRSTLAFLAERDTTWAEFKTPSLRNVARTAPYMHDGRFATLGEVVAYYSTLSGAVVGEADKQHLRPLGLPPQDQADLTAFLETLSDSVATGPAPPVMAHQSKK